MDVKVLNMSGKPLKRDNGASDPIGMDPLASRIVKILTQPNIGSLPKQRPEKPGPTCLPDNQDSGGVGSNIDRSNVLSHS